MSSKKGKRRRLRAVTKSKSYPWNQSPLFRLRSKRRLYELLNTSGEQVRALSQDTAYRLVPVGKKGKERLAQVPQYELDVLHTRVASLIRRVAIPDYLHSGIKGRSHVSNAEAHLGNEQLYRADISSYFPSVSRKAVFHLFNHHLECSPDVSGILAELLTYEGHIPTGSRVSMPLAFWCTKPLFDRLQAYAESTGAVMTVYVDDVTFSGKRLPPGIDRRVPYEIRKAGYGCNSRKCRLYCGNEPKEVTGVILRDGQLRVPNRQHRSIYEGFMKLEGEMGRKEYEKAVEKLSGAMASAGQIEEVFRRRSAMVRRNRRG